MPAGPKTVTRCGRRSDTTRSQIPWRTVSSELRPSMRTRPAPRSPGGDVAGGAPRGGGGDRAFRVVPGREGGAEGRHHGVADELLHRPAEGFDLTTDTREVGSQDRANVFGIELLRPCGEADEVGEEHGHD